MRIRISRQNDEIIDKLKSIYKFKSEGVIPRIAFAYSIQKNEKFNIVNETIPSSDGKDFRDEKGLFGTIINGTSNYVIYKSILETHYQRNIFENEFSKLFRLHLNHGLEEISREIDKVNIVNGGHINFLMKLIKNGLDLQNNRNNISSFTDTHKFELQEYSDLLTFILGENENNEEVIIRINDLKQFDNRNIAIAGMAGSGKTQLIKDVLFQISKNTNNNLKYIFFDYKGEGSPEQLNDFLTATNYEFVDLLNDGLNFNPLTSININEGERQLIFSIKAFIDTIATFVPSIGVSQKNILQTVITELIEEKKGIYPNLKELFEKLANYYENTKTKPDTLYSGIKDLASGLFSNKTNENILAKNIYLNLPPALSDTLRQLSVFLLLRYFNFFFSSTNDVEPTNDIIPLRYIIVIDEAHIYLKNKNARKALEDLLRLLRSKGVIVIMLSQGVEDYKTREFDFSSQVKLPICLNIKNKDTKLIKEFIGTPRSEHKLNEAINKLQSGHGVINIVEPESVKLRQFWETIKKENS